MELLASNFTRLSTYKRSIGKPRDTGRHLNTDRVLGYRLTALNHRVAVRNRWLSVVLLSGQSDHALWGLRPPCPVLAQGRHDCARFLNCVRRGVPGFVKTEITCSEDLKSLHRVSVPSLIVLPFRTPVSRSLLLAQSRSAPIQ